MALAGWFADCKEELVARVAEGRILGALPSCPKCKHGQVPERLVKVVIWGGFPPFFC